MCQEPTELFWIGCLTGWISILKFRFGTLIPNISSQTYWPKVISHVTNGTIFFVCSTSAISTPFAALRITVWLAVQKRWRRRCKNRKEEERSVAKSKSTAMNLSSHVPTSSSSAKSLIASKSPGILTATGKLESRIRGNSESDAASSSQARLEDAYLGGLMDKGTEKLVATKEEPGDVDLSESETGSEENVTGKPVAN